MIPIELELIERLGRLIAQPWASEVTGVQIDSRRIDRGRPVRRASASRAPTSSSTRSPAAPPPRSFPTTRTPRSRRSRGEVRDRSTARVVGITGATGKTTTKDILAALCAPHRRTVASEGNYNNELGVPLTLCRLEPDTELCIVEMGMRGLGQIAWLASFARPDVGADHEHRARAPRARRHGGTSRVRRPS